VALQPIRSHVLLRWRQRLFSLYVPVLLNAACAGMLALVIPFEVDRLGGSAAVIGAAGGIFMGAYVLALLLFGSRVDPFDPRTLVLIGLVLMAGMILLMRVAPNLIVLLAANACYGMLAGLFWPPIMGWISSGHEGPSLNRRLSLFNISWSTGMIIGPPMGGYLYELAHTLPFYACLAYLSTAILVVTVIRSPVTDQSAEVTANANGDAPDVDAQRNDVFRPMARIAHLLSYVTIGIFRYQVPSLALVLGISAARFGGVLMCLSLSMAATFYLLGRTQQWHYRLGTFFAAQIVLVLTVLAFLVVQRWWEMAACMLVGGACVGVVYSSDLFYGVSGGVRRARRMAIHELILSVGFVIGAFGGGFITDHIGLRTSYPICAGLLVTGMIVQAFVYAHRKSAQTAAKDIMSKVRT
jgi:MFS transporter, DHA1 family, solute carrier family 18 (vesicular amine transporter), member 1/2